MLKEISYHDALRICAELRNIMITDDISRGNDNVATIHSITGMSLFMAKAFKVNHNTVSLEINRLANDLIAR
jgi:hypothetical protein